MSDELESFEDDAADEVVDSGDQFESSDELTDDSLADSFDDEFAELAPTPVEETDAVLQHWRDNFGEAAADTLQNKWGDSAVAKDAIVTALLNDTPDLGAIYSSHQSEDGGLTLEGVSAAAQYLLDNSNFKSPEELSQAHLELDALYFDHADQDGAVSPAGVAIMLAYLAEKSGYKHTRKRRE